MVLVEAIDWILVEPVSVALPLTVAAAAAAAEKLAKERQ